MVSNLFSIEGKTALNTGGSRGIGAWTSLLQGWGSFWSVRATVIFSKEQS
jgi:hypothetical protein